MEGNINLFPGQITFKSPECFPCVNADNRDSVLGWPEPQITFPVPDLRSAQLTTDTLCSSKNTITGPSLCCLLFEPMLVFLRENGHEMKRDGELKVQSNTVSLLLPEDSNLILTNCRMYLKQRSPSVYIVFLLVCNNRQRYTARVH